MYGIVETFAKWQNAYTWTRDGRVVLTGPPAGRVVSDIKPLKTDHDP
jgi:hypothetical protein